MDALKNFKFTDNNPAVRYAGSSSSQSARPEPTDQFSPSPVDTSSPQQTLKALSQSGRVYYDAGRDELSKSAYYKETEHTVLNGGAKAAFDSLHELVSSTHTPLDYKPKEFLLPWVDLRPGLRLQSIYSASDIQLDAPARGPRRAEVATWLKAIQESPTDAVAIAAKIALAEAKGVMNCEHVVPQTWADNLGIAVGDLHHLFAADSLTNLERSDRRLSEFSNREHPTSTGEGWQLPGGNQYEPAGGKGALARATLYFLVRYPGLVGDKEGEYTKDDVTRLVEWSNQNPVSLHEKHRNQAIQEKQGNRNPFIDHPEWVSKVDFNLGLGSVAKASEG
jgi:endonuclease G